ncbi:MAG TPA: DinB family protein [Candidatus Dormibacteraeota bacterium]|jgi:uncharacterized damage-inducible protein DinB|nr:DinB family protein [Candidatus Dormibacteraeota bacterium]
MAYLEVFQEQYREVYGALLEVIASLPAEAMDWPPYTNANSIAVLVTHILGNQLETLRTVSGVPTDRNRDAEFRVQGASSDSLRDLVVGAEAVMAQLTPQITSEQLEAMIRRPSASTSEARTGLYHLNHSIAHAREHLGQIWMTRDLWRAKSGA